MPPLANFLNETLGMYIHVCVCYDRVSTLAWLCNAMFVHGREGNARYLRLLSDITKYTQSGVVTCAYCTGNCIGLRGRSSVDV